MAKKQTPATQPETTTEEQPTLSEQVAQVGLHEFIVTKNVTLEFTWTVRGDNPADARRIAEDLGEPSAAVTQIGNDRWATKRQGEATAKVDKHLFYLACGHVRSLPVGSNAERDALRTGKATCLVFNPTKGPEYGTEVKIVDAPVKAAKPAPAAKAVKPAAKAAPAKGKGTAKTMPDAAPAEPVAEGPVTADPDAQNRILLGEASDRVAAKAKTVPAGQPFPCPICSEQVRNTASAISKHEVSPKHIAKATAK
jgi:hypothetical protein